MKRIKWSIATISILLAIGLLAIANKNKWWQPTQPIEPKKDSLSAKEEYMKLVNHFSLVSSKLNMAGLIRIYDQENNGLLKETTPFSYIRNGGSYYLQFSYIKTFCDGKIIIQLDTVNRMISISKVDSTASQPNMMGLDSYFSDTAKFKIMGSVEQNAGERTLLLKSDLNPELKSCSIIYDSGSYQIHSCVAEYWKDAGANGLGNDEKKTWLSKTQYRYQSFKGLPIEEMMVKVINIRGKEIIPTEPYKDYKIGSNLQ